MRDIAYIFDIDGTLTPSLEKIDKQFEQELIRFQMTHNTYFVTGSDFQKTLDQIGFQCLFLAKKTFHCSGNEVREKGKIIYKNTWEPSNELLNYLQGLLKESNFPIENRTSNFIEMRDGSLNFSIVGRSADKKQRAVYAEYDKKYADRQRMAEHLRAMFTEVTTQIGGEISMDIMPLGFDKSQIVKHIPEEIKKFFGDRIFPFGNDYSLAETIKSQSPDNLVIPVTDWKQTQKFLNYIME